MKKRKLLFFKAILMLFSIGLCFTTAMAQFSSEVAFRNDTLLNDHELQVEMWVRSTLGGDFYYAQDQYRFTVPGAINGNVVTGLTGTVLTGNTQFTNLANVPTSCAALSGTTTITERIAVTSLTTPQTVNTLIPMNSVGLRHITWKLSKGNGPFVTGTTVTWTAGTGGSATAVWYMNASNLAVATTNTLTFANCNNPVISPINTTYTLSGGSYCTGGSGATVTLSGSETGVRYQLYNGATKVGGYVAGTGSPLTWTNMTAGTYTVFAWRKATYISNTFVGGTVVAVDPVASVAPIIGQASVIQGTNNVGYSCTPDANATSYVWSFDGGATGWSIDAPGNTSAITIDFGPAATSGTLHVKGTNAVCGLGPDSFFDIFLAPALNTWTGAVGNDWFTPGNWSNVAVPGASDAVDIPAVTNLPIVGGGTTALCGNAEVHVGASITITGKMTVSGTLTLDGGVNIVVKNGGSFIDAGISGSGTATVEKSFANGKWHYISSPISNATSNVVLGDWLAPWDCALQAWGPYITATTTPLNVAEGYATYTRNITSPLKSFTGNLNTGVVNHLCANGGAGYFCLVGNAYPSAIDLTSGSIVWPGPAHNAYFWDPSNQTYKIYTTVAPSHSQFAPSAQGFFIEVPTPGSFGLAQAARVHNSEAFLKDNGNYPNVLKMSATNLVNNFTDEAVIGFVEGTTTGYDYNYDAAKLANGNEAPSVFSLLADNQKVAYNIQPSLTESTVVPMGFTSGINGNVTFNAENLESFDASASIYLEDLKEGYIQNLKSTPAYTFTYNTGDNANRFVLHFSAPTSIGEHSTGIQIYSFENSIYIKNLNSQKMQNVFVYDLLGKEVFHSTLNQLPIQKFTLSVNGGYYLVKVVTETGVTTQKVYLY